MDLIPKEKLITHPLEDVFNIEPGTTVVEYQERVSPPLVELPTYDEKDKEIEEQYQEVYETAMDQVQVISDEMERVQGQYKARMGEVTATMLTVALNAAREKAQLKMHKDKQTPKPGAEGAKTVNNNLIVADRNELLRALMNGKSPQ